MLLTDAREGGKAWLLALIALTLAAGIWRAAALERESLSMDEIMEAEVARGGMSYEKAASVWSWRAWRALVGQAAYQQQPPLDYAIQRFTNQFSSREASQRAAACLFGSLTIFLTGLFTGRLGGPVAGLYAAFLMAISPLHVVLSRTARPYTIALLLWMLVLGTAWRAWRSASPRDYALLGVMATLFLLSRGDLPVFALGALALAFAVLRNWRGVAAITLAAAVYLPFLLLITHRSTEYIGHPYPGNFTRMGSNFVGLAGPAPWFVVPLIALGAIQVFRLRDERRNMALVLILVPLLTVLLHGGYFLRFVTFPRYPRYLLYALFPMTMLAGFGAQWLVSTLPPSKTFRVAAQVVIVIALLALAIARDKAPTNEDWRAASRLVSANSIDSVWMFRAGAFFDPASDRPYWIPPFFGDWYNHVAFDRPVSSGIVDPSKRRVAIVVWGGDSSQPTHAPRLEAIGFTEYRPFGLQVYLPEGGDKSVQHTLDASIQILSGQAGSAEFDSRLSSIVRRLNAEGKGNTSPAALR